MTKTKALLALIAIVVLADMSRTSGQGRAAAPIATHGPFYVRSYIGKCLTYGQPLDRIDQNTPGGGRPSRTGPAEPIFIYDCIQRSRLHSALLPEVQQIVVEEINERHEVLLRAGTRYLGVVGNIPAARQPLELQDYNGGPGQVFALDGDSIIVAGDRGLVVEIFNGRGANQSPLVLGLRDLADTEFWDFKAADGTDKTPTLGFTRAGNIWDLKAALQSAHWGTVIQLEPNSPDAFALARLPNTGIPAGVTLRGNRRGLNLGPELSAREELESSTEFEVHGDHVRITGIRFTGPSRSQDRGQPGRRAILVPGSPLSVIIDNNKMSDWTSAAVEITRTIFVENWACSSPPLVHPRNVLLFRNFIHHNTMEGAGYGVVVFNDGSANIKGNTFLMNRHAIAADGSADTTYSAYFNLVLSNVPSYGVANLNEHDFDMHGSDGSSHHTGGIGGSDVDIARNTFLGSNRRNFDLRGMSCGTARFANNVSQQNAGDALRWYVPHTQVPAQMVEHCNAELFTEHARVEHSVWCGYQASPSSTPPVWVNIQNNRFDAPNPTNTLGTGDFDGDGRDDLLLATGQAWYYSPGANVEWRYLNKRTEPLSALRFGDFDGDKRTDVLTKQGNEIAVSWGGASEWQTINATTYPLADLAVGDFDGDKRADLFHANGVEWFVSSGASGAFTPYATSGFRLDRLRFCDFDADGRTDVFSVVSGQWQAVFGGAAIKQWTPLRPALTDSVQGLVVADFDGDGRADVGHSIVQIGASPLRVSRGGTEGWTDVLQSDRMISGTLGVGRFDDVAGADAVFWGHGNERAFDLVSPLVAGFRRWSTQEMR